MSCIGFAVFLGCLVASTAAAQESRKTTSVFDFEGRKTDWSTAQAGDSSSKQVIASLNGTRVPIEQTEEKVLVKETGRTVVEKTIHRRTSDGRPLPPEKTRIETSKAADGTTTEIVTVFRTDLNGTLLPSERQVTHSLSADKHLKSETVIERPSINGSFAPVERRAATVLKSEGGSEAQTLVYRPDANGRMSEAARQIVRTETLSGVTTEQSDEYENATTGHMQLSRQSITRLTKNADGTERREVDVFGVAAPGRAVAENSSMQLRERQIYDQRKQDGKVVEQFSIQRPSLSDSKKLSAPQLISETVCEGKCK